MKCIICSSNKNHIIFNINNYKLYRCLNCGIVFLNPYPTKYELNSYYKKFNYETGFKNEKFIRNDAKRTLRNLYKLGYNKGLLLDIGCGAGFLLDEARKQGWRTLGIDSSFITTNYAKEKLHLNVIQKDIKDFNCKEKAKVITLIQVIEHITNPIEILNKIKNLLANKGILCISTPNIESILYSILQEDFNYLIPPEHVLYYAPETISKILKKVGFAPLKITTYSYSTDMAAIIKRIIKEKSSAIKNSVELELKDRAHNKSLIKKIKSLLFDGIFCKLTYPLLNLFNRGSMLEVYAIKE